MVTCATVVRFDIRQVLRPKVVVSVGTVSPIGWVALVALPSPFAGEDDTGHTEGEGL